MVSSNPKPGDLIGDRYIVESLLARCDSGSAYLCRDHAEKGSFVVLRILPDYGGPEKLTALRRELPLLTRCRHHQLAPYLGFGVTGRCRAPYLVREYVEGNDIFQGSQQWSLDRILNHLAKICRVLHLLHTRGIVHRHLKPSNIVITGCEDPDPVMKLLDYGLEFRTGKAKGNPKALLYTAPEVLLGHAASPRSDLYSLGILAYQLLARRLPFEDDNEGYLIQKHLQGKVDMRPIERLKGGSGLAQALLCLLEKDPGKRPSSAEDAIRLFSAASGRDWSNTIWAPGETYFSISRFLGREKEMATLQTIASRVREAGRGWTCFLKGESGAGKSRLLDEFKTWTLLEGWRVVEASCQPREDRSYAPYRRILAQADMLRPGLGDAGGDKALFRFDELSKDGEPPKFELSSGAAAGPFRDQLTREIVRLLADRPTILLLHDFHWADEATVTILDYLTSDMLAHPVFLCVSLRPGETEQDPLSRLLDLCVRQQRAEAITLTSLPLDVIKDMIASMTGEPNLAREIASRVYESSGGNPFFVEEILRHLVDRGLLRREAGQWHLEALEFESLKVPSSIASVLRHRLDQLSQGASRVAQWFALFKHAVPREQLRILCALSMEEFEEHMRALIEKQVIREIAGCDAFELQHTLFSEVIAGNIPTGMRRHMHRRIAEMLEKRAGDQDSIQELALHLIEGRCTGKAIPYALRAARTCKAEFANEMALRFYEYLLGQKRQLTQEQFSELTIEAADTYCALGNPKRAIRILKSRLKSTRNATPLLTVQLLTQLSRSFQYLGKMNESEVIANKGLFLLKSGAKHTEQSGAATECAVLSQLAFCLLAKSQPHLGLARLRSVFSLGSRSLDTIAAGHLNILISALYGVACDFRAGAKAARAAISSLEPQQAFHLLPMAYSHFGNSLAGLGRMGKALREFERSAEASLRTRSPFLRSQALCNLAECNCRIGNYVLAIENSNQAVEISHLTENPNIKSAALLCRLEAFISIAEWSIAYGIRTAITDQAVESLPIYLRARALYLSAFLFYELGSLDQATSELDKLCRLAISGTKIYESSLADVLRAKIFLQRNMLSDANDLLSFSETQAKLMHGAYQVTVTKLELAEMLAAEGDLDGAATRTRDALKLARAMPALHLQAIAHYLQGKIAVLQLEKASHNLPPNATAHARQDRNFPETASAELEEALRLCSGPYMMDTAWRVHHMMARLALCKGEFARASHHAQECLRLQSALEARVPPQFVVAFRSIVERVQARDECEEMVRRACCNGSSAGSIEEMEADHLRLLYQASSAINAIRDLEPLLNTICATLSKAIGMTRTLVMLRDEESGRLGPSGRSNFQFSSLASLQTISRYVIEEVFQTGRPFVSADTMCDPRLTDQGSAQVGVRSVFCAPLVSGGLTLGLLYADHQQPAEGITSSTINMFAAFCNLSAVAVDNALSRRQLIREKSELELHLQETKGDYPELIGASAAMDRLRKRIGLAAASPLDVLITGESGTGKELVARALHRTGRRAACKFLALDCGSLSDSLVESELFGYRKGAFTGATDNRPGLFEAAEGGVIFLDEISNLSLRTQRKLLRVLQEREVRRIGDTVARKVNVQVIAATNKDLRCEIREGKFRDDLYFRLNAMEIHVPRLRDRAEDIPQLLAFFLDKVAKNEGGRKKSFSREALSLLASHPYPGNVRELKHIVEGAYYSTPGVLLEVEHLPVEVREGEGASMAWQSAPAAWPVYKRIRDGLGSFEGLVKIPFQDKQIGRAQLRQIIHLALAETRGKYRDALRLLGIPEREYAIMIQFLKRNGCYLDFRPYRKRRRRPPPGNDADAHSD